MIRLVDDNIFLFFVPSVWSGFLLLRSLSLQSPLPTEVRLMIFLLSVMEAALCENESIRMLEDKNEPQTGLILNPQGHFGLITTICAFEN